MAFSIPPQQVYITDVTLARPVGVLPDGTNAQRVYVGATSVTNLKLSYVLHTELCGAYNVAKASTRSDVVVLAQAKNMAGVTQANKYHTDVVLDAVNAASANKRWRVCLHSADSSVLGNLVFALAAQEIFVSDVAIKTTVGWVPDAKLQRVTMLSPLQNTPTTHKIQWVTAATACAFAGDTSATVKTNALAVQAATSFDLDFDTSTLTATNLNKRVKACLKSPTAVGVWPIITTVDKAFELTSTTRNGVDGRTVDSDILNLVTPHELLLTDLALPVQRSAVAAVAQKVTLVTDTVNAGIFTTDDKVQFVMEATATGAFDTLDPLNACPVTGADTKGATVSDAVALPHADLHTAAEVSFDFSSVIAANRNKLFKMCLKQAGAAVGHTDYYQQAQKVFDVTLATKPAQAEWHAGGVYVTDITSTEKAVLQRVKQRVQLTSAQSAAANFHASDKWMFKRHEGPGAPGTRSGHCPGIASGAGFNYGAKTASADAVGGTGSKKGVLTAAFAVGTDKDWYAAI